MSSEGDQALIQETLRIVGENAMNHVCGLRHAANQVLGVIHSDYRVDMLIIPFAFNRDMDLKACILGEGKIDAVMMKVILEAMLLKVSEMAETPKGATHGGDSRTH